MKRINMEDRKGDVVCYLSQAILNKRDKLIDIIWDEHYLIKLLEDYFKGYEVHLIPKNRGK